MNPIRVLLADDHPALLEGLGTVLEVKYPQIDVVGTAADGEEVIRRVTELKPDLVLMDIKMPKLSGTEAAKQIKRRWPDTKVLMLTTFDDRELIADAINAGANGYLLKETPIDDIVKAVEAVHEGNVLVSEKVVEKLVSSKGMTPEKKLPARPRSRLSSDTVPEELVSLTKREREIYALMVRGMTNQEIADELDIREKTVRNHVHQIYESIGVHNRTQAVLWGMEHGFG
jgi:DNA-binding NarL/FixJ family response regulator